MRTVRLSIVVFGSGCVCPGSWGCLWGVSRGVHALDPEAHPPVDRRNDTRLLKHYLPATAVEGGKYLLVEVFEIFVTFVN